VTLNPASHITVTPRRHCSVQRQETRQSRVSTRYIIVHTIPYNPLPSDYTRITLHIASENRIVATLEHRPSRTTRIIAHTSSSPRPALYTPLHATPTYSIQNIFLTTTRSGSGIHNAPFKELSTFLPPSTEYSRSATTAIAKPREYIPTRSRSFITDI
jgi:hypothetical protein